MIQKCMRRFIPLAQLVSFVVAKLGVWEGGTQQYFGFPVLPEIEGLKYTATMGGKQEGDNGHPGVLSLGE